jgi:hypothetical protein
MHALTMPSKDGPDYRSIIFLQHFFSVNRLFTLGKGMARESRSCYVCVVYLNSCVPGLQIARDNFMSAKFLCPQETAIVLYAVCDNFFLAHGCETSTAIPT